MSADWVTDIRDQCLKDGVAFHVKQWGGVFKKRNGRKLEGRTWDEMPAAPQYLHFLYQPPATASAIVRIDKIKRSARLNATPNMANSEGKRPHSASEVCRLGYRPGLTETARL